jgi:hypothetical protein
MDQPTCQAQHDSAPCIHAATLTVPVRLCDEHKLQVAASVVPEMLASALREARAVSGRTLPPALAHLVASAQAAPMPATDPHSALVYFMANGGRVKVGYTKSLFSRVQSLSLREDAVLLLLHGGMDLERALHAKFGAYRVADSEWFELAPDVVHFISGKGPKHRSGAAPRPTRTNTRAARPRAGKKPQRRSMDEWVAIGAPVFRSEFARLRRNPSGTEFAAALDARGYGRVSASTAKNIRAEILDRAPLPSLDGES